MTASLAGLGLDHADLLAARRQDFTLPARVLDLDGNALGALPDATALIAVA